MELICINCKWLGDKGEVSFSTLDREFHCPECNGIFLQEFYPEDTKQEFTGEWQPMQTKGEWKMTEKQSRNAAAIPDITKAYCTVVENYTRLARDESGRYQTDWIQEEAASLREMIWQLAKGEESKLE